MQDGIYVVQNIATGDYKINAGVFQDMPSALENYSPRAWTGMLSLIRQSAGEVHLIDSKGNDIKKLSSSRLIESTNRDVAVSLLETEEDESLASIGYSQQPNTLGPAFNEASGNPWADRDMIGKELQVMAGTVNDMRINESDYEQDPKYKKNIDKALTDLAKVVSDARNRINELVQ